MLMDTLGFPASLVLSHTGQKEQSVFIPNTTRLPLGLRTDNVAAQKYVQYLTNVPLSSRPRTSKRR